jgi:hypothetical protein
MTYAVLSALAVAPTISITTEFCIKVTHLGFFVSGLVSMLSGFLVAALMSKILLKGKANGKADTN